MAFRDAVIMDHHTRQLGENGMPEFTANGVGSDVLALSQLVRGGDTRTLVDKILAKGTPQEVADLVVLAYVTRNTRGGKGEKKLAYDIFLRVYEKALPETALSLLKLFPHYGYWKDLILLIKLIKEKVDISVEKKEAFFKAAVKIMSDQLATDMRELETFKESNADGKAISISLLAKWLPREGSSLDKSTGVVDALSRGLFSSAGVAGGIVAPEVWKSQCKRTYRKVVSELTSHLGLPEVLLAAQREEEIDFGRVASRATMQLRRVFMNEDKNGGTRSENPKRIALAKRFVEHTIENGLKGAQVMPHEIVAKIINNGRISDTEALVLDAQWTALRDHVVEQLKTTAEDSGVEPTKLIPLSDVSGSMHGTPMEVSIALGILLSEITHPAFRDMVLTFESEPRWHRLESSATIVEKVRSLQRAPWGGSTNFAAAYRLILEVARNHRLKKSDMPCMIVFSDMQFDVAQGYGYQGYGYGGGYHGSRGGIPPKSDTMHELIAKEFQETARALGWDDEDPTPMVYWNVRNTGGHPVDKDTEGAVMLSGFSPSLLKLVMDGKALEEQEVEIVQADGSMQTEKIRVTPAEILRKMLDDQLYDPVRTILGASREGKIKEFEVTEAKHTEGGDGEDFEMVM